MRELKKYIVAFTWKKYIGKDEAVTTNVLTVDAHSKDEALGKGLAQSREDNKDGHLLIELVSECPVVPNPFTDEELQAIETDVRHIVKCVTLDDKQTEIRNSVVNKIAKGNARAVGRVEGGD